MNAVTEKKLFLVGNAGSTHIGGNLYRAAQKLGLEFRFFDCQEALTGSYLRTKLNWWFLGHRPNRLGNFSGNVVEACKESRPSRLIATGIMPIEKSALKDLRSMGVHCCNYLTDDPWNPALRAPWFMETLPLYDHIFTPRKANLDDLRRAGCNKVTYLQFAYAPELHYPEDFTSEEEKLRFTCDVVFVGGADRDRVPYIRALMKAGLNVHLYGNYWDRYPGFKNIFRGSADPKSLRLAHRGAKIVLGLVRRANRDGHSMRTYETPAINACMVVEDTPEHREIFGADVPATVFFSGIPEMIDRVRWLLAHDELRRQISAALHQRIIKNKNTYQDRLVSMLEA